MTHAIPNAPGTYVLDVDVEAAISLEVGALGSLSFEAGRYAYVGSAFGPGGLGSRVDRHHELATGERDVRHWHVDYLLGHPTTRLVGAATFPDADRECALAGRLPGTVVPEFGASDCECPGHLVAAPAADPPLAAARPLGGVVVRFE